VTACLAVATLTGCARIQPAGVVVATGQNSTTGGTPAAAGTAYVPRVSEKKLEEFLKGREHSEVTDTEVYAIMGEPTRRDAPITGQKNGQTFTVYKAYWEAPGSGVTSQIAFANGRCAGMILGLETSPRKSKD
jgi:hypothetical protein